MRKRDREKKPACGFCLPISADTPSDPGCSLGVPRAPRSAELLVVRQCAGSGRRGSGSAGEGAPLRAQTGGETPEAQTWTRGRESPSRKFPRREPPEERTQQLNAKALWPGSGFSLWMPGTRALLGGFPEERKAIPSASSTAHCLPFWCLPFPRFAASPLSTHSAPCPVSPFAPRLPSHPIRFNLVLVSLPLFVSTSLSMSLPLFFCLSASLSQREIERQRQRQRCGLCAGPAAGRGC